MSSIYPYGQTGQWFKGQLHTHTTQSDGKVTPAESMLWHTEHGFHFVALTDHNRVTDPLQFLNPTPLLAISSVEINAQRGEVGYHVLAIGVKEMPITPMADPQDTIDAIEAVGGISIIAHPYWNDHQIDDLLPLQGHIGIEIFNTGCWLEIQKGHSLVHWDALLRRGQHIFGLATDDAHWNFPDAGLGWVTVWAEQLDTPSILKSLQKGWFYSSMGPEIYDIQVDGTQVTVRCSPARSIFLIGDIYHCPKAAQAWDNRPLTEATFTLHPQQQYLRVEVVDMENRSAWSNATFIEK